MNLLPAQSDPMLTRAKNYMQYSSLRNFLKVRIETVQKIVSKLVEFFKFVHQISKESKKNMAQIANFWMSS